jgi:hypothetical protein
MKNLICTVLAANALFVSLGAVMVIVEKVFNLNYGIVVEGWLGLLAALIASFAAVILIADNRS